MTRSSEQNSSVRMKYGKQFVMGITIESTVKFAKVAWT